MKDEALGEFVGVFDSGAGGISVLRELVRELPAENFVYFGDGAHNPYGEKSDRWVRHRSFAIVDEFREKGAKAVVIACNTATSAAAGPLRRKFANLPIVGVEPALKPAVLHPDATRVLVMATPMTLRLDKFQTLAKRWAGGCSVAAVECPGLAAAIERDPQDGPALVALVEMLVGEYRGQVDAVVLGCTHYRFVAPQIRQVLGPVALFDGAAGTARQLRRRLGQEGLLAPDTDHGCVRFFSSSSAPGTLERYHALFVQPFENEGFDEAFAVKGR